MAASDVRVECAKAYQPQGSWLLAMQAAALLAHDEVLRNAIEAHDGVVFSCTGDGVVAAGTEVVGAGGVGDR